MTDEKRLMVLAALRARPQTVDEFVTARHLYVNSWAPVFTQLRYDGEIERTGEKRQTSHGSDAHVLRVVDRAE